MVRRSLYGEEVEFFNGSIWKPIKDYKKGEKILIYYTDGTVMMSTPNAYIKRNGKLINNVKNSFLDIDISDKTVFHMKSYDMTTISHKSFTLEETYTKNFNYFLHYLMISVFENCDTSVSSMLTEDKIKIMTYGLMLGETKGINCKIVFDEKREASDFKELLNRNKIRYNYDRNKTVEYRLPRDKKTFIENPLTLSKKEIILIIDTVNKISKTANIFPKDLEAIDFIQMVFALGGIKTVIKGEKIKVYNNPYPLVGRKDFTLTHKEITQQYSFTSRSGFLVLRSKGNIVVMGDYKK